jgi:hypothetical protein
MSSGGREFWLLPDATASSFTATLEPGWVSPSYGVKVPTTVIVWRTRGSVPLTASCLFADAPLTRDERSRVTADLEAAQ